MEKLSYQIGLILYSFLLRVVAPFNKKASQFIAGRKNLLEKLQQQIQNKGVDIWFHAASLGEFEQARPVIEAYRKQYPEAFILLTFFSPSGYEVRKNYNEVNFVSYIPIDSPSSARSFVQTIKPKTTIFVKYEFWHFLLKEAREIGSQIISISTIFRPGQIYFKKKSRFHHKTLTFIDHFFVQNQVSADLLKNSGFDNYSIVGDTRFDRVKKLLDSGESVPRIERNLQQGFCLVAGSTWQKDNDLIVSLNSADQQTKLIIAPHEIHDKEIETLISNLNGNSGRYSSLQNNNSSLDNIIVDTIGQLSKIYRYADVAYIGGAFGSGLHNILEAATYGIPILFGPKYHKFQEAVDLIQLKGAYSISNATEFITTFNMLKNNEKLRHQAGSTCRKYVEQKIGATTSIMTWLNNER